MKRGSKWAFVIELPRDPATGKRRQKWFSGYATKKEAAAARHAVQADLSAGTYTERSRQTVGAYLGDWLEAVEPTLSPSTFHSYQRNLRLHVIPRIGQVRLPDLDAGVFNKLYSQLLTNGHRDKPGGLKPRTVRYIHTTLHRAFKDAVRWGRLPRNPVAAADPPGTTAAAPPEMAAWDARTLSRFLELSSTSGDHYFPAWYLIATTGLRRGEALGLRWSDLNLESARASIRQTIVCVNHEPRISTPKTTKSRRVVALDQRTVAVLTEHHRRQQQWRQTAGAAWPEHDLAFTLPDGRLPHPERFSREFDRRITRWNLPRIRLHDLRHTWATLALEAGVHPKVVSERLGHANITITLDTYSHVTPAMQEDAAETVADLLQRGTQSDEGTPEKPAAH